MIWMYIIGAIVAQAIVVVLLNEYMNRRGQCPAEKPQEGDAPPAPPPPSVTEVKESIPQTISPAIADDAVGLSNFSVADLKAMMEEVVRPIRDCMETQGNRIKLWPRQGFHEGNLVKSLHGIDVS